MLNRYLGIPLSFCFEASSREHNQRIVPRVLQNFPTTTYPQLHTHQPLPIPLSLNLCPTIDHDDDDDELCFHVLQQGNGRAAAALCHMMLPS